MKNVRYILIGLLVALPLLGFAAIAHGQGFRSGDNITVPANQTVDSTLYVAGKTIDIAGNVNGDVFCAGQNVTISGNINGDVMCAGQSVEVSGKVSGDVRLAGQNVTLSGKVDGNASIAGSTIVTSSQSNIARDLSLAAQEATLNGPVGRDLAMGGNKLIVNSTIGRDVQANLKTLVLGAQANITGDISYTSDTNLQKSKGATLSGTVTRSSPQHAHVKPGALFGVGLAMAVYLFVSLMLLALLLVLIIPRALHVAAETARGHMLKTFLVGFIASLVVPLLLVVLALTVVGLPFALLAGLVWLLIVLLSGPFAAYLTGRLLLQATEVTSAIWTMLLGAAVLLLLYFVPFLGVAVAALALWFGIGAILLRLYVHVPRPHYYMSPESAAVAREEANERRM